MVSVRDITFEGFVSYEGVGGPWLLVVNYVRENDANVYWDRTHLPSSPLDSSHLRLSAFGIETSDVLAVRFYCRTSSHDRVIDFSASNTVQKEIAVDGTSSSNSDGA